MVMTCDGCYTAMRKAVAVDAANATLTSLDVALRNIHYDKFTDASTAAR